MFFRDEGEIGDVINKAKMLFEETRVLEKDVQSQKVLIAKYREHVLGVVSRQNIKNLIGEEIEDLGGVFAGMVSEWREKKKQLEKKEKEIALQQQAILEREAKIESQMKEFEVEQKDRMSEELQKVSQLSENVMGQLDEVEKIKNIIDNILAEDEETISDSLLSKEDVEFLRLNYSSLMRSRLTSRGVVNPLTREEYNSGSWELDETDEEITAEITRGRIKKRVSVGFKIKFLVPADEEGFIYQKAGKDTSDVISGFVQVDKDGKNSFGALVLVSPTGWSEWIIDKVTNIRNINKSVYLVDLNERKVFFNDGDKKTKLFVEWFVPVSMEEEIRDVVAKLEKEIEGGKLQFRADKVALQYQVPRKIVMEAFKEIVGDLKGDIILPEEGAKDVIFLVK